MEFIPNIEAVRKQTAESGEEITQHWVDKIVRGVSNAIWQEAKGGNRTYQYLFDDNNIVHKRMAMSRAIQLFRDAGYTVEVQATGSSYWFSW